MLYVANGKKIACEYLIDDKKFNDQRCVMDYSTKITEENVQISTVNLNILTLTIFRASNVFFLPVKVAETFPNLIVYQISKTSLRKISKRNFKRLYKLKDIYLVDNKVEIIFSDTFEDLVNLKKLKISKFIFYIE